MSEAPQGEKDPPEASHLSHFGEGAEKRASPSSWSPLNKPREPPPPPGPAPSGPTSRPQPQGGGGLEASTGFWPGNQFWQSQALPGYSTLRQQPLGGPRLLPQLAGEDSSTGPGEPVTSASGGGNEVGGVEGLKPAWGVSRASQGGRSSRPHWGQVSEEEEACQLSPAPSWPSWPDPLGRWLLRAAGLEGLRWAWTQGSSCCLLPGNYCKDRAHPVL